MTKVSKQHYIWEENIYDYEDKYTTKTGINVYKPVKIVALDQEDNDRFIAITDAFRETNDINKYQNQMNTMLRHMKRKYIPGFTKGNDVSINGYSSYEEACKGLDSTQVEAVFIPDGKEHMYPDLKQNTIH